MSKMAEYFILLMVSFAVPTIAVANKWGAQEAMFKNLLESTNKIERKVDKLDDDIRDVRERVIGLENREE